ncbi:MAG TPA: hypothetical protein VNM72_07460 [Blastocatellia bacterium]|nr:hypothetical protein [Blastocatellia bacterium]
MKELASQLIEAIECLGVPRASVDHLLRAQKEMLLAVQAVIESGVAVIDELLQRGKEKPPVPSAD